MTSSRRDKPSREGISVPRIPSVAHPAPSTPERPPARTSPRSIPTRSRAPTVTTAHAGRRGRNGTARSAGRRSLLARRRARARRRGRDRGADARRDRTRLRPLDRRPAPPRRAARELRARRARLRRRHRRARDRDHRLASARAVLRVVDARVGEPHRDRPRRARARLLARRPARGPRARAEAPRRDRARGRVFVAVIPFAAKPFLDFTVEGLDTASAGAVVGELPRRPAALRAAGGAPRDGLAVRDPARGRVDRDSRGRRGQPLRAVDCGSLLGTFLPALVLIPAIGTQRTFLVVRRAGGLVVLPARHALPRRAGAPRGAPARPPGAIKGRTA